jgi:TRAP-type C4-dicarboxylate transport system substrate-binding protein
MIRVGNALRALLPLAGALALMTSAAQAETTLRLLSAWTPNNPNVPYIETVFIKNVEAASKGQLKIERRGPEVASPFEQLQPVSAGVFDILFTTPGYHQAQTGVANMFDAFKPDMDALRAAGLTQKADEYYRRRYGLSILALHPAPGNHFVLKDGLAPDGTLKGMKIRANATFEGAVRALGGTPVNMSPADAYSAMQKGVLEGITFPAFASADYKLYEVGKFMTRPLFGLSNVLFLINVRKLNSLSPELQKIVLDEGRKIEQIGKTALERVAVEDETRMKQNGVKIVQFSAELAPKLNPMYNDGILATAGKSSPNEVKELWELAKAKGLLNQ